MIKGQEFHHIIENVFRDVKGVLQSEQLQVNCPRCQEREGLSYPDGKYNLEINTSKRVFRCWKCDEPRFSGSLEKLIRLYGSHSDYELYKSYASILGDVDYSDNRNNEDDDEYEQKIKLPDEMISFANLDPTDTDHFEAYNYLINDRKLTRDIILKYRLGFCIEGRYKKRIIIPSYTTDGDVNYFVARTYDSKEKRKYLNPKLVKDIIFNEGLINWDFTVNLVEGAFEMLSIPTNTVPMLGKTLGETLFNALNKHKPNLIIALDPDAYKDALSIYYMIYTIYVGYEDRIKILKLPNNDDLDEIRKNKGVSEVTRLLRTARKLIVDDYFEKKLSIPDERKSNRYNQYSIYFRR